MNLPAKLCKNDKIGVVALSDPVSGTEVVDWVKRGVKNLQNMGFDVALGSTLFTKDYYTSDTALNRWKDFEKMIRDPSIKAIITAIGGENAHQILPFVDFKLIAKNPKIILGYSDPTVLLNSISKYCNMPAFYGPHVISFDPQWAWYSEYTLNCFKTLLMKKHDSFIIPPSKDRECWNEGVAKGCLVGGCLVDLMKLLATPWEPDWKDKILILESINQTPQNIDVCLTQLCQAGVFNKIKGLILGTFHNCITSKNNKDKPLKKIFKDILQLSKIPILKTVDFGHFSHICPFPLGAMCEVDATNTKITLLKPIVI